MRWMAVEGRGFPVSGSTFMIEGDNGLFSASFLFFHNNVSPNWYRFVYISVTLSLSVE